MRMLHMKQYMYIPCVHYSVIKGKTEQAEAQQRPRRGRRPKRRHASEDSSCVMDASESHSVANLSSQSETDKHAIKDAMKYLLKVRTYAVMYTLYIEELSCLLL